MLKNILFHIMTQRYAVNIIDQNRMTLLEDKVIVGGDWRWDRGDKGCWEFPAWTGDVEYWVVRGDDQTVGEMHHLYALVY